MQYLIDGYNLLHAMGRLQTHANLEKARLRLLNFLATAMGDESSRTIVVFDAAHPPSGATEVQDFHGIQVRFAVRQEEADDLIEQLIRRESAPRKLTVVSDDHRLQKAARRRECPVMGCAEFLEALGPKKKRDLSAPSASEGNRKETASKPESLTPEETQHWLREFAGLENEKDYREVFNPFDFDEPQP